MRVDNPLILALDGDWDLDGLCRLARSLSGEVGFFKIGKRLFTRHGPEAVRRLKAEGQKVFLDLKFHDIPNTVGQACEEAVGIGCDMLNVHASGGRAMMLKARRGVDDAAYRLGRPAPILLAVTVLTSITDESLAETGVPHTAANQVVRLARLANECGLDGVVASPQEIRLVREAVGERFKIVTPGVRPAGEATQDQKRVTTPAQAVQSGADYLVIGRPIYGHADPAAAARAIRQSLRAST